MKTNHSIDAYNLLPDSFSIGQRVRRVFFSWLTVVGAASVIFLAVAVATVVRRKETLRRNQQVAVTAVPLMDLRRDVLRLQADNVRRESWCQTVESSRPDDSMLQVIAGVALASRSDTQSVLVDKLHVRLPIEYAVENEQSPEWAVPTLKVSARLASDFEVTAWMDRLNLMDRIENARNELDEEFVSLSNGRRSAEIVATPLATKVLP
ncbi:MAG: hypothetical protein AB8B91_06355 [Rubripirellula sp.]